tara:strand:+ start:1201 stop:1596 length:396 start_codon:yes stop_codon:yes gene_type:complete
MKKINVKEEVFVRKFISLYIEIIDSEFRENKKKVEKTNEKIVFMLHDYPLLFKDLGILYNSFEKIKKKKKSEGFVFNEEFKFFLEWTFEELYKNKIVNKKTFDILTAWLTNFNIESRKSGPGELAGAAMGF